jgi:tetratricopeptide (TPR) repeat protein
LEEGRRQEALAAWEGHARLGPERLRWLSGRAWALASNPDADLYRPQAALQLARLLDELSRQPDPIVLDTLGLALAAQGEYEAAAEALERALQLLDRSSPELARSLRERLELYRQGRSYRGGRTGP